MLSEGPRLCELSWYMVVIRSARWITAFLLATLSAGPGLTMSRRTASIRDCLSAVTWIHGFRKRVKEGFSGMKCRKWKVGPRHQILNKFWRIPWTEELGGLQSMGLQRVGHD